MHLYTFHPKDAVLSVPYLGQIHNEIKYIFMFSLQQQVIQNQIFKLIWKKLRPIIKKEIKFSTNPDNEPKHITSYR